VKTLLLVSALALASALAPPVPAPPSSDLAWGDMPQFRPVICASNGVPCYDPAMHGWEHGYQELHRHFAPLPSQFDPIVPDIICIAETGCSATGGFAIRTIGWTSFGMRWFIGPSWNLRSKGDEMKYSPEHDDWICHTVTIQTPCSTSSDMHDTIIVQGRHSPGNWFDIFYFVLNCSRCKPNAADNACEGCRALLTGQPAPSGPGQGVFMQHNFVSVHGTCVPDDS
jgi:hypothetical protein